MSKAKESYLLLYWIAERSLSLPPPNYLFNVTNQIERDRGFLVQFSSTDIGYNYLVPWRLKKRLNFKDKIDVQLCFCFMIQCYKYLRDDEARRVLMKDLTLWSMLHCWLNIGYMVYSLIWVVYLEHNLSWGLRSALDNEILVTWYDVWYELSILNTICLGA